MRKTWPYPKDYSTHLPILIAIPFVLKVKMVLEFGAGMFSTPLFLNREVYPDVEKVVSCETNRIWITKLKADTNITNISEGRLSFPNQDEEPDDRYDLVFADSATEEHKVKLIDTCSKIRNKVVVIHDAESGAYRNVFTKQFNTFYDFQAHEPCTAIAFNQEGLISERKLAIIADLIEKNCIQDPTDVSLWLKIFKDHEAVLNA